MLQQAIDFREESEALFALLESLEDEDWERKTQFKEWTINDVLAHLHFGNYLADLSLQDSAAFTDFMRRWMAESKHKSSHMAATHAWLDGTKNRALLKRWREFYQGTGCKFQLPQNSRRLMRIKARNLKPR